MHYETNSPPKHLRDCTGNSMENMYTDKTKCLTFIFHLPGTGIEVLLKIKKEDLLFQRYILGSLHLLIYL